MKRRKRKSGKFITGRRKRKGKRRKMRARKKKEEEHERIKSRRGL